MRKLLLAVLLCVTAVAFAGNSPLRSADRAKAIAEIRKNQPQTSSLRLAGYGDLSEKITALRNLVKSPSDGEILQPEISKPIKKTAVMGDEMYHRVDSIVAIDPWGDYISKEIVLYTNVYLDDKFIQMTYDVYLQQWSVFMEEEYTWDEDEYLIAVATKYPQWNYGSKYEVTYDKERDLILTETSYMLNGEGEWEYSERLVREFDDNDDPVLQTAYRYDGSQWVNNVKRESVYDNQHRELDAQVFLWMNETWYGDFRMEYAFDQWGHHTLFLNSVWDDDAMDWVYYKRTLQEFSAPQKLIYQEIAFWNTELNAWVGTEYLETVKAELTYDEQGRLILDIASKLVNYTTWVKAVETGTEYTDLDNGGYRSYSKTYFYDADGINKIHLADLIYEFDNLGRQTYLEESHFIDNQWVILVKETSVYEGTNPRPVEVEKWLDDGGVLFPDIRVIYTFDEALNLVEMLSDVRDYSNPEPAWMPGNWWKYEYVNGIQSRKFGWRYDGTQWNANLGDGIDYDFNLDPNKLIYPMNFYPFDYKVLKRYVYEGGSGMDFFESVITYYYSEQTVVTKVTSPEKLGYSVYPNPTAGVVNIDAPDNAIITVISLNGTRLLETYNKQIDLSRFAPGMYILDVNGIKTKLLKQ